MLTRSLVGRALAVGGRYGVAWSAAGSLAIVMTPMYLVGVLAIPIRDDLRLTRAELGLLVSVFMGIALLCATPAGQLVDRRGITPTFTIGLFGSGVGGLCIGAFGSDLSPLFVGIALCGAGLALVDASTNMAIARSVPEEHQAMSYGLWGLGPPIAALVCGLVAVRLGEQGYWRQVFVGLGLIAGCGVICAVQRPFLVRDRPPPRRQVSVQADAGLAWAGMLGIGMGLALGCATAVTTYAIDFAQSIGLNNQIAGALVAFASGGVVAMRLLISVVIAEHEHRSATLIPAMLVLGAGGHFALALQAHASTVVGVLVALILGFGWTGAMFLVVARMYPNRTGRAGGFVLMGTYAGAVVATPAFGWIVDHHGYDAAWLLSGACALASAVILTFVFWRQPGALTHVGKSSQFDATGRM